MMSRGSIMNFNNERSLLNGELLPFVGGLVVGGLFGNNFGSGGNKQNAPSYPYPYQPMPVVTPVPLPVTMPPSGPVPITNGLGPYPIIGPVYNGMPNTLPDQQIYLLNDPTFIAAFPNQLYNNGQV